MEAAACQLRFVDKRALLSSPVIVDYSPPSLYHLTSYSGPVSADKLLLQELAWLQSEGDHARLQDVVRQLIDYCRYQQLQKKVTQATVELSSTSAGMLELSSGRLVSLEMLKV